MRPRNERALSKPSSSAEGFQSWMWRGLTFLLPFLFFGQVSAHRSSRGTCRRPEPQGGLRLSLSFSLPSTTSRAWLARWGSCAKRSSDVQSTAEGLALPTLPKPC